MSKPGWPMNESPQSMMVRPPGHPPQYVARVQVTRAPTCRVPPQPGHPVRRAAGRQAQRATPPPSGPQVHRPRAEGHRRLKSMKPGRRLRSGTPEHELNPPRRLGPPASVGYCGLQVRRDRPAEPAAGGGRQGSPPPGTSGQQHPAAVRRASSRWQPDRDRAGPSAAPRASCPKKIAAPASGQDRAGPGLASAARSPDRLA